MAPTPDNAPTISMFSNEEEERLSKKTVLDEIDRKILTLLILSPKISNEKIGEEVGLNRIQVWRRRTKGPLATVLLEFQKEALSSASDLVINAARDAVESLDRLARGECDCSPMIRDQAENHRIVCLTPVPYAVRRAAAKDLVDILMNRKRDEEEQEEEVWAVEISSVGGAHIKQVKSVIDIKAEELRDETNDRKSPV